ncbi:MAG TPA: primosomal protein N' [Gemmatimonadales bacterium]|nr:primosomal protein N' [Gemmatimonadales bacterium]
MTDRFAQVALPLPLATPYTYQIPETLADRVAAGARVVVPVRGRELIGIVTSVDAPMPAMAARPILGTPDDEPALPAAILRTVEWIAGYYAAPIGLALKAALPAGLWGSSEVLVELAASRRVPGGTGAEILQCLERKGGTASVGSIARALKRPVWDAVDRLARVGAVSLRIVPPDTGGGTLTERVLVIPDQRPTLLERQASFRGKPRQRALFEAVEQLGGTAAVAHLQSQLGFSGALVRALVTGGHARVDEVERVRDPFAGEAGTPPPDTLSADQRAALSAIEALAPGEGALLFGVTGSGKTLVYLEAIRRSLEHGRGAIVLVPEIGLTPQTVRRIRGMFGDDVAVLHSGLSDGERADAWRALRRGDRRVAVGARSAIFAPIVGPGVIVVDEEHEATYKNGEAPRYHAREVAAVRARLEGTRLVLGSATPSLESWSGAGQEGRLALIGLPERVGAGRLPPVEIVDLRTAPRIAGAGAIPWSEALDAAVGVTLARGEQGMLLLNRRGFAAFLQCPDCGHVPECPSCSISLTVHQSPPALRCHYCAHEAPLSTACVACGHPVAQMRGIGTQQLERWLAERFPAARLARMDLDTTSTKWAHHRIFAAVERGTVDLLLGTQMIAKGLDFPNVTLVGVVDADTALHLPDFRSAERTFQLIAQVAGRAGRGPRGGRVVVQTRQPAHHALVHAAAHDAQGFLTAELGSRRSPAYPPATGLVNLVVSGRKEVEVGRVAAEVAEWAAALAEKHSLELTVLGPAPCPLVRIKDRWRWHVALKGEGGVLGRVVRYATTRLPGDRETRVTIDRDPVSLL